METLGKTGWRVCILTHCTCAIECMPSLAFIPTYSRPPRLAMPPLSPIYAEPHTYSFSSSSHTFVIGFVSVRYVMFMFSTTFSLLSFSCSWTS